MYTDDDVPNEEDTDDDDAKKRQMEEALILAGEDPVKLLESFKSAFGSGSKALNLFYEDDADFGAGKEEVFYLLSKFPYYYYCKYHLIICCYCYYFYNES